MEKRRGPWTILSTALRYQSPFFEVYEDQVIRPDGKPGQYATVSIIPGVAVLPIDQAGQVYLTRQFRYSLGRESLEVACGGRREDETAQQSAERELREELGIEALQWTNLGECHVDTSIVWNPVELFLAQQCIRTAPQREGTEQIETIQILLAEAAEQVVSGGIVHALSCTLILKAYFLIANMTQDHIAPIERTGNLSVHQRS